MTEKTEPWFVKRARGAIEKWESGVEPDWIKRMNIATFVLVVGLAVQELGPEIVRWILTFV